MESHTLPVVCGADSNWNLTPSQQFVGLVPGGISRPPFNLWGWYQLESLALPAVWFQSESMGALPFLVSYLWLTAPPFVSIFSLILSPFLVILKHFICNCFP